MAELNLDKDELMRYLNGEIEFADWKQGQDLMKLFSTEENVPESTVMTVTTEEPEEDSEDESDDDEDERDVAEEEQGVAEEEQDVAEKEREEEPNKEEKEDDDDETGSEDDEEMMLDEKDEEYVPPGVKTHKGKIGRPRKPKSLVLTPKRSRGRPRKSKGPNFGTREKEDLAMSHELALSREERRLRRRKGGSRSRVPKQLRGLMGEAHLCFARREHQEAIMMCLEIIRQAPRCPDTYQLLGMIYEDKEDMQKSLQFSLLAAHLKPTDTEEWTHCAEMCMEQGDVQRAIHCYTKAIRYNPKDLSNHLQRINLYEQLNDNKKTLECYQVMLKALPEDSGEEYMQLAKDMVKVYHKSGDISSAVDILETAFAKHPKLISSADVNILTELLITNRNYQRAIQVICNHCGVVIRSRINNDVVNLEQVSLIGNRQEILSVEVPDGIPIDLQTKLCVCLIHCRQFQSAKDAVSSLLTKEANELGDLFLDVAEAYIELGCYTDARPILQSLIETENYDVAAVWLRYADCLTSLGELELSMIAYRQVLHKAPGHLDATIALSSLEQQQGNSDVALELLSIGVNDPTPDVQLVWHRALLLFAKGLMKEFIQDSLLLLSAYFKEAFKPLKGHVSKELCGNIAAIGDDEWYSLYCKVLEALIKLGRPKEADDLSEAVVLSRKFQREPRRQLDMRLIGICVWFQNARYRKCFREMRHVIMQYPGSIAAWNLFSLITNVTNDTRHHKFCLRLTIKKLHDNFALCLLNGHNAMVSGTFKNAIGEYVRGFRQRPDDPLLNFMIGISIFHIACQRYTTKRHSLIVQAFAFLKRYEEFRGVSQETCYNIGRALHQIGLLHIAVRYYHRGLEMPPSIDDPRFDLRSELAFNLALIYQQSGNEELAIETLNGSVV